MKKLTKKQVDTMFREELMPSIRTQEQQYMKRRSKDIPMRCEAYNNFVDGLQKDGLLTNKQAETYGIPSSLI